MLESVCRMKILLYRCEDASEITLPIDYPLDDKIVHDD